MYHQSRNKTFKTKTFRPKYNTKTRFSHAGNRFHSNCSYTENLIQCTEYCKININDFQLTPLVNAGLARCTYLVTYGQTDLKRLSTMYKNPEAPSTN